MANMGTPNLYEPFAFDATKDFLFKFSYAGAQAMKNRLVIKNNVTNTIVYNVQIETMQLTHNVPAGTLSNGTSYNAVVIVYDKGNNASQESAPVIFYCYTTPTLTFTNLTAHQVINSSNYELQFNYTQLENEPLNTYQVVLYNSLQEKIYTSGSRYPNGATSFKYDLSSLDDNASYYVQAIGETLNHMVADTGLITFSVEYINPSVFATVGLENLSKEAQIKIQSNIISIIGKSEPSPPIYIDDKEVDATAPDSYVKFDEGFQIDKDFTMHIKMRKPPDYSNFLVLNQGKINHIEIKYMRGTFASQTTEKGYFELRCFNAITNYLSLSNYIDLPQDTDYIHLWVQKRNDVYEIRASIVGGVTV